MLTRWLGSALRSLRDYFAEQEPTFWPAFTPALVVSALLFVRSPLSNYIFDEQEALLANPYVNGNGTAFWDALRRDFWGLPPERSIGSYRPIPNLVWRALWRVSQLPFLHHWVNVVGHAVNGALVASLSLTLTRDRSLSWLAGGCFVACAVLTEAVSGVVGIADVLGGLGVLTAIAALRLPMWAMPGGVFLGLSFGLFSKESAIVGVPLIGWAALVSAPAFHEKPRRLLRALMAVVAACAALFVYTEVRRHFFPVSVAHELAAPLPRDTPWLEQSLQQFLRWFRQPQLPNDLINNPLVTAEPAHRIAGALRVYARGLGQLLFPWKLSGDYSFPQEPVPTKLLFSGSIAGAFLLVALPVLGLCSWVYSLIRERRWGDGSAPALGRLRAVAFGAMWLPVAYFPHSNIAVLLPTVRAERFWYLPAFGSALLLAVVLQQCLAKCRPRVGVTLVSAFFAVQMLQARSHACDYSDDLTFWRSTRRAVPNSAKAHLNYSVMVGARGDLQERLQANRRALELAPEWAMAHVYYGDTLCRMRQPEKGWPHYKKGFELSPNDPNLIALGLQCLWDQHAIEAREAELLALSQRHPGSWLAFLATDIAYYGKEHGGVQKKYRPRSYDEGPKTE